jgi:hypothetical protein
VKLDSKAILTALETRRVEVGNPTGDQYLKQFEEEMALSLDTFFRQMYSQFNGFATCDDKSQIFLWPLEVILQNRSLSVQVERKKYFAIGDLLIDSDFVMCCLEIESAPIFLLYEKRELAPTASTFFDRFVLGEFDFNIR